MFKLNSFRKLKFSLSIKTLRFVGSEIPKYKTIDNMTIEELFAKEPFEKEDTIIYPRERPGLDYKLNWSLCRCNIVPWGEAWRNSDYPFLISRCSEGVDKNLSVPVNIKYSEEVEEDKKSDFEDLSDMVKKYMSGVPDLYVEDAGLGSTGESEAKIRTITNDPVSTLFMKNMTIKLPVRDAYEKQAILSVIARGYNDEFTCLGRDPNNDSYTVCFTGQVPFERVMSDLALCYKAIQKPESSVLITGSLLAPKKGGLPSLVIGDHPKINALSHSVGCLYGAHHILLHPTCSSRLWGGVYHPIIEGTKTGRNDLIINGKMVCSNLPADNALELPGTMLFVDKTLTGKMAELPYEKAQEKFKATGYSDKEIETIIKIAKLGKIEFYALNDTILEETVKALA